MTAAVPGSAGHRLRLPALFLIVLTLASIPFQARLARKMPDLEVYWRAAVRARAAEPLYRAEDAHYQFKYLPAFAVLAAPMGAVPLRTVKGIWATLTVAGLVVLLTLSLRLIPARRRPAWLLVTATLVVMGKFYGHELTLGQVNVAFAVIVCTALWLLDRREIAAGALFALAVVVKPYAVIFLPWLATRGRWRPVAAALAGLAIALALPVPIYGISGTVALHRAWWETVTTSTAPNLLNQDNVSVTAMWAKWLGTGPLATALAAVTGFVLVAATGWIVARRRGIARSDLLEAGVLLVLIPLLSPQGWDYVFLIATPAIVLLIDRLDALPPALRMLAIVALAAIGLSLFDVLGRRGYAAFMALSLITVCFLVVIGALAVLRARRAA